MIYEGRHCCTNEVCTCQPSPAGEGAHDTLKPEDVPSWLQIKAGSELSELVRVVRFSPGQQTAFLHSDYDAAGLLWRWALKHFRLPTPSLPPERAALVERLLRRVAESSVCNAFHSAMGQPHCQRCGRNEDLHLLREAAAALRGETGEK